MAMAPHAVTRDCSPRRPVPRHSQSLSPAPPRAAPRLNSAERLRAGSPPVRDRLRRAGPLRPLPCGSPPPAGRKGGGGDRPPAKRDATPPSGRGVPGLPRPAVPVPQEPVVIEVCGPCGPAPPRAGRALAGDPAAGLLLLHEGAKSPSPLAWESQPSSVGSTSPAASNSSHGSNEHGGTSPSGPADPAPGADADDAKPYGIASAFPSAPCFSLAATTDPAELVNSGRRHTWVAGAVIPSSVPAVPMRKNSIGSPATPGRTSPALPRPAMEAPPPPALSSPPRLAVRLAAHSPAALAVPAVGRTSPAPHTAHRPETSPQCPEDSGQMRGWPCYRGLPTAGATPQPRAETPNSQRSLRALSPSVQRARTATPLRHPVAVPNLRLGSLTPAPPAGAQTHRVVASNSLVALSSGRGPATDRGHLGPSAGDRPLRRPSLPRPGSARLAAEDTAGEKAKDKTDRPPSQVKDWSRSFGLLVVDDKLHVRCPRCTVVLPGDDPAWRALHCQDLLCEDCCQQLVVYATLRCPCCAHYTALPDSDLTSLGVPRDAADLLRLSARSVLDAPDVDRFLESVGAGCPVCLDAFCRQRPPMRLDCGHSVCRGCCAMVQEGRPADPLPCPVCRATSGAGVRVNGLLLHVVAELTRLWQEAGGPGR